MNLGLGGLGGVIVEIRSVTHDEETCLPSRDSRCCFLGTLQENLGHGGVIADRFAVADRHAIAAGDRSIQFKFPRDHGLGEVPLADKIRDDVDVV